MNREPTVMEGQIEFYPFTYILSAAQTAIDAADLLERTQTPGRNHPYIASVVFSAFAIEAALNHIGMDKYETDWKNERKIGGWKAKLEFLAERLGMPLDFTTDPAKTVETAFEIRDKFAHGKTWVGDHCYWDDGTHQPELWFPDAFCHCFDKANVVHIYSQAVELVNRLKKAAGYRPEFSDVNGGWNENRDATPRPPVWKIKGTVVIVEFDGTNPNGTVIRAKSFPGDRDQDAGAIMEYLKEKRFDGALLEDGNPLTQVFVKRAKPNDLLDVLAKRRQTFDLSNARLIP